MGVSDTVKSLLPSVFSIAFEYCRHFIRLLTINTCVHRRNSFKLVHLCLLHSELHRESYRDNSKSNHGRRACISTSHNHYVLLIAITSRRSQLLVCRSPLHCDPFFTTCLTELRHSASIIWSSS